MKHKILASFLFILLVLGGAFLSYRKPLWTDEIHTQVKTIDRLSPIEILGLHYFPEGNMCPLFYLGQEAITYLFQYTFPVRYDGRWNFHHTPSQLILRIPSTVCMSLALTLIFYFFSRKYSVMTGLFALGAGLCTPIVWNHIAEARHYSLWILLTVIQSILFLKILSENTINQKDWLRLAIVHLLLSFTVIFSLLQILVVSFLLRLYKEKRIERYAALTFLPVMVTALYFYAARKMHYWADFASGKVPTFSDNAGVFLHNWPQILKCFPLQFIVVILLAIAAANIPYVNKHKTTKPVVAPYDGRQLSIIAMWAALMVGSSLAMLYFFVATSDYLEKFPARYFAYLTPVSIFTVAVFSARVLSVHQKNKWLFCNLLILILGFIAVRACETFIEIYTLGLY